MNLNEVKKHVIVQILCYILIGLTFILSLIAILITPAHASELKTSNITGTIKNTTNCGNAEWNHYCFGWGYYSTTWDKAQFSSSLGFGVEALAFDLSGITAYSSSPSTIEIYNAANTFINTNYSCFFSGSNQPVNCSVSRVNNGRINVNFTTSVGGNPQYLYISIGDNPNGYFEGLNGININKVMLLQTIDDPNENIIENANKNTDDIINNNNENTNVLWEAIHGVTDELINRCPNLISPNLFVVGSYAENNGDFVGKSNITSITNQNVANGSISITASASWWGVVDTYYIPVTSNSYYLKFDINLDQFFVNVYFYNSNKEYLGYHQAWNSKSMYFAPSANAMYMRIAFSSNQYGNITISNLSLTGGNTNFCPYGSSTNKLDGLQGAIQGGLEENRQELEDIHDIQQDQYDYLSDDSDPTLNNQGIADVLDEVEVSDPLNYLLTLPISLLQKLNIVLSSNACQRVSFGSLYNTELYLPCIDFANILGSSIWGTIDLIVGVGLLAIILKRFYESISNILTLGKEKEVKDKLDLPTPMEFFAHIIGGGRD